MKRINWTAALSKPVEESTLRELRRLLAGATDWKVCACGNHCDGLSRYENGAPKDFELNSLGCDFYRAVDKMVCARTSRLNVIANASRKQALAIHNKIERRAAKLLAKMEAKS